MSLSPRLQQVTAQAVTPDQLLPYVAAVSGSHSRMLGDCVVHTREGQAVLVAYPLQNPASTENLDARVAEALALPGIERLTVLAPIPPASAPAHAQCEHSDDYWAVPLPAPAPGQKLRNMLRRAERECRIVATSGPASWTEVHQAIMLGYIQSRPLEPGMRHIFQRLDRYLATAPDTMLFSAYDTKDTLQACTLGDFSSLSTAFYMFAFRRPSAPPGTADALLAALLREAELRGHSRCNLGLGINSGIGFFKQKWGAQPFLHCVQTSWDVTAPQKSQKSWFSRIFSS